MSDFLRRFAQQFAALDKDNLHQLDQLYTHDLHFTDHKVYRHRDYFDAGSLIYEHLPVLGRAIAWLKRRMG